MRVITDRRRAPTYPEAPSLSAAIASPHHPAAADSPLFGDWLNAVASSDPGDQWSCDANRLAARASQLVYTDAIATAIVEGLIQLILGPNGLAFRSQYQLDQREDETSEAELAIRRDIDASVRRARTGTTIDPSCRLTAREVEEQILWSEIVAGDGVAVRVVEAGRPDATHSTGWRAIDPARVCNPPADRSKAYQVSQPNSDSLYEGIELDPTTGRPLGIHIRRRRKSSIIGAEQRWDYVPWRGADGTPNVIWSARVKRPGGLRGVSWFAPLLILAKHLAGTTEAYAVAKRIQACHPIIIKTDDPGATERALQTGCLLGANSKMRPGKVFFTSRDGDIVMPAWQFNGADHQQFIDSMVRSMTAALGLPFEWIMAQMSNTSWSASRTVLLQVYRTATVLQDHHIAHVTSTIDRSVIAEDVARRRIRLPASASQSPEALLQGTYQRPPRAMPDPYKEAQAAREWFALGRSLSSAYAEQGWAFEDEVRQRAEDVRFLQSQGLVVADGAVVNAAAAAV